VGARFGASAAPIAATVFADAAFDDGVEHYRLEVGRRERPVDVDRAGAHVLVRMAPREPKQPRA
jgi:hypothetical protein